MDNLYDTEQDATDAINAHRGRIREATAQIEAILGALADALGASDADRRMAADVLGDLMTDLAWQREAELQNELTAAQDAIARAEDRDLRRNAPVVL